MNPTITNFWNYFKEINFALIVMSELPINEKKRIINHFSKLINLYNKDLDFVIITGKSKAELIITAHGNPYLFKEVELLVHYAPQLEYWNIKAFTQPDTNLIKYQQGTDKPLEYYGIILKISEMYFEPIKIQNKPLEFGIRVYIKNYIIHCNNVLLPNAVYIHLEHLLGEKSFANDISLIDIAQIPSNTIENELINLYNLASFIKQDKLKCNI
jgi:hypothetical protein